MVFDRWEDPMRVALRLGLGVGVLVISSAARGEVPPERERAALEGSLTRALVVGAAVARHPALRAARERARAAREEAAAEGSLPSPEAMVEVWQVPLAKPYAIGDAGMVMLGLRQRFPAAGSLGAREAARASMARGEEIATDARAREITREASHAFTDYAEAFERARVHTAHHEVARRVADVASARHAAGGALTDVAQADVELAMAESDAESDAAERDATQERINVLLGRAPSARLGPPSLGEPVVAAQPIEVLLAAARAHRPSTQLARVKRDVATEEARAARKEATIPSFSLGVLYFAPVGPMPAHGYGASVSAELPWIWGAAAGRARAGAANVASAELDEAAEGVRADTDVAAAATAVRTSAIRLRLLLARARPASERAFEVAWTGFETRRTDLLTLLAARRAVVDTELAIVAARASLEHALTDLDWTVGADVARAPLAGSGGAR